MNIMENVRLKPCPFCGGKAKLSLFFSNYHVTCTECLGGTWPEKGMSKEEAIAVWNSRKLIDTIKSRLKLELSLADKEKERCVRENQLQFDSAKCYANGIAVALEIVNNNIEQEDF